ncbi:hypothetical protein MPSEU_001082100 [Mayamaea pseudoterrestris]|nr:hypothetical protein MPSEU_001082100 [Mayamaea pseudoterrestris]
MMLCTKTIVALVALSATSVLGSNLRNTATEIDRESNTHLHETAAVPKNHGERRLDTINDVSIAKEGRVDTYYEPSACFGYGANSVFLEAYTGSIKQVDYFRAEKSLFINVQVWKDCTDQSATRLSAILDTFESDVKIVIAKNLKSATGKGKVLSGKLVTEVCPKVCVNNYCNYDNCGSKKETIGEFTVDATWSALKPAENFTSTEGHSTVDFNQMDSSVRSERAATANIIVKFKGTALPMRTKWTGLISESTTTNTYTEY